jgi:hypothetical protein
MLRKAPTLKIARLSYILKTFEVKEEIERGVKVHNWPHIILKNNA